ncbi:MAG: argE [Alphaproteobacteria bacterium]|nr:argE [Alphaproteobacteria bacterium]
MSFFIPFRKVCPNIMTKTVLTSHEMLAKLVSFDTTSVKSNLELIHWVQDYMDGYGIKSHLVYDETKNKANLHAVIGPADKAGIVAPIHFALSYDEELGCLGAHSLAEHIANAAVKPKLCVVGEPTMMKTITGHKGICDLECTVHGKECHSSLAPYSVNAVEYAAELIAYSKSVARRFASEGPFNKQFDPPFTTVHVGMVKGGTALNIVPNLCEFSLEVRNIPEVNPETVIEEIRQYALTTRWSISCCRCRVRMRPKRSVLRPKPASSTIKASRRSSAAQDPSLRRTSRMNSSPRSRS